jgi:hypothetical protein
MNAMAGANPEASTITEVIAGDPKQAAQPRPVRLGDREFSRKIALTGSVKGLVLRSLVLRDESRHE